MPSVAGHWFCILHANQSYHRVFLSCFFLFLFFLFRFVLILTALAASLSADEMRVISDVWNKVRFSRDA